MKNQKSDKITTKTTKQLADVSSVELDNVTGGCAACGNAACSTNGITARRFGWR